MWGQAPTPRAICSLAPCLAVSFPSPLPSPRFGLCFASLTASSEDMAPRERTRAPPTCSLEKSGVTDMMTRDMETCGVLEAGQTTARPRPNEVVVFRDFFAAGLRFPLDPVVMEVFKLHKVFLHQMTPMSFLRLNI